MDTAVKGSGDRTSGPARPASANRRGIRAAYRNFARRLGNAMPKGLYARSLIIIITPVVVI
ncbi:MAG: two-component sensor histidine kinase, partial [Bauldia litoralis]